VAVGVTLIFAGGVLFAMHGAASVALRNRRAPGQRLVSRSYNVLGLAVSTIGFLASGATALYDILRRYLLEADALRSWEYPRPGGSIAFAAVFLPLAAWFAWRVWQEFAIEGPSGDEPAETPTDDAAATTGRG
jgi:hypothetical protein